MSFQDEQKSCKLFPLLGLLSVVREVALGRAWLRGLFLGALPVQLAGGSAGGGPVSALGAAIASWVWLRAMRCPQSGSAGAHQHGRLWGRAPRLVLVRQDERGGLGPSGRAQRGVVAGAGTGRSGSQGRAPSAPHVVPWQHLLEWSLLGDCPGLLSSAHLTNEGLCGASQPADPLGTASDSSLCSSGTDGKPERQRKLQYVLETLSGCRGFVTSWQTLGWGATTRPLLLPEKLLMVGLCLVGCRGVGREPEETVVNCLICGHFIKQISVHLGGRCLNLRSAACGNLRRSDC